MFDPVTIDQLRTLITVVETGNFSAAARKLQRVQSAVSTAMSNLESQLGVTIWDRSTKIAALTEEGRGVLARAKRVVAEMDTLRAFTLELSSGLEPRVSICVDALFPTDALVDSCEEFTSTFPTIDLRVDVQTMSSVSEAVLRGNAKLGIVSPLGVREPLVTQALSASIVMVPVVAPNHALSNAENPIPTAALAQYVQVVLSERSTEGVPDQAVLSPRTWRVADLGTKYAMLLKGLGWGNLPENLVVDDLANGRLIRIQPAAWAEDQHRLNFFALHRSGEPLGRAHQWLLDNLEARCKEATKH